MAVLGRSSSCISDACSSLCGLVVCAQVRLLWLRLAGLLGFCVELCNPSASGMSEIVVFLKNCLRILPTVSSTYDSNKGCMGFLPLSDPFRK
jgi:hypothetical protein